MLVQSPAPAIAAALRGLAGRGRPAADGSAGAAVPSQAAPRPLVVPSGHVPYIAPPGPAQAARNAARGSAAERPGTAGPQRRLRAGHRAARRCHRRSPAHPAQSSTGAPPVTPRPGRRRPARGRLPAGTGGAPPPPPCASHPSAPRSAAGRQRAALAACVHPAPPRARPQPLVPVESPARPRTPTAPRLRRPRGTAAGSSPAAAASPRPRSGGTALRGSGSGGARTVWRRHPRVPWSGLRGCSRPSLRLCSVGKCHAR